MAVTDLATLKIFLGISTGTTGDDSLLADLLARAQKQVESYCNRSFDATTSTRYYRQDDLRALPDVGGSGNVLWLGADLLSVSTLINADDTGTVISSTGYWLEPRNSSPYQWVRLRSSESWVFGTDGEISVAGTWGYSTAPPADIVQATLRMAAYLYRQRDASVFDVTASPELGIITVPQGVPTDVRRILDDGGYRRRLGAW